MTLILFDCRQERCWNTIPTSKGLCRSVGGSNEESKALVAIRDEISFSPGYCRCCSVGPFTFDFGRLVCIERCWKTIPTSKGLYCRSVGGLNEESKALVAIRD